MSFWNWWRKPEKNPDITLALFRGQVLIAEKPVVCRGKRGDFYQIECGRFLGIQHRISDTIRIRLWGWTIGTKVISEDPAMKDMKLKDNDTVTYKFPFAVSSDGQNGWT